MFFILCTCFGNVTQLPLGIKFLNVNIIYAILLKIVIQSGGGLTENASIGHKGTNCVFKLE